MMSGNNAFKMQGYSLDELLEYRQGFQKISFVDVDNRAILERYWEESAEMLLESSDLSEEVSESSNDYEANANQTKSQVSIAVTDRKAELKNESAKSQEVRMQEIEEYVMEHAVFRKINGFLCIWDGRYYRQLDIDLFTQVIRSILPKDSEKRISRFNRFKEAYNFMLANETLEKQFSEKVITETKAMIAFSNCIFDGRTGEVLRLSPAHPILFNIDAKYLGEKEPDAPHMDQVILSACGGDKDVLELFYQTIGYIFSQGIEAKKFFVFATAPDSGKSIIGEFLSRLIGDENISVISLNDLGQRFSLGRIGKKALNYNMDLPSAELDRNAVQKIKQLTGDPRIDCEEKYVQNRTVTHHCKFLYASNHPVRLKEDDEAFYRRMVLIPFLYSVDDEEKDYELLDKLWAERHAIATKAAHAFCRLYHNNYIFQHSDLADEMIHEWRNQYRYSFLQEFGNEKCIFCQEDNSAFVPTDKVFKAYQIFAGDRGLVVDDSEKIGFSKKFRDLFHLVKQKKRVQGYNSPVNGYVGLYLKENED